MRKPKLALVGYGQMGREIEKQAKIKGYMVTDIFDSDSPIDTSERYDFDVAIEFTEPSQAVDNIKRLTDLGKNVVVGTTGWLDEKEAVEKYINEHGTGLVWASNFSVGVQMFFKLVSSFAQMLDKEDDYDVLMHEFHHKRKKDSPSGTARTLAERLIEGVGRKEKMQIDPLQRKIEKGELHVSSTRGGEIAGTHIIMADSLADTIELTHRAKNRSGFALGSLQAASWIHGRKGFHEFGAALEEKWG